MGQRSVDLAHRVERPEPLLDGQQVGGFPAEVAQEHPPALRLDRQDLRCPSGKELGEHRERRRLARPMGVHGLEPGAAVGGVTRSTHELHQLAYCRTSDTSWSTSSIRRPPGEPALALPGLERCRLLASEPCLQGGAIARVHERDCVVGRLRPPPAAHGTCTANRFGDVGDRVAFLRRRPEAHVAEHDDILVHEVMQGRRDVDEDLRFLARQAGERPSGTVLDQRTEDRPSGTTKRSVYATRGR